MGRVWLTGMIGGRDSGETDLSYSIIWYRIVPVRYCTYLPGAKCVYVIFYFFSFPFLSSCLSLNEKSLSPFPPNFFSFLL